MFLSILLNNVYFLIFAFAVKHFLADYPLQTPYMLRKTQATGWVLPLLSHAGVHASFTFFILAKYGFELAMVLALVDGIFHFFIDWFKSSIKVDITQSAFWVMLGLDQLLHYLTYLLLIYIILQLYLSPLLVTAATSAASAHTSAFVF